MKYRYEIPESERQIFFNGVELKSPFSNVAPRATLELNDMMIVVYTDAKGVFCGLFNRPLYLMLTIACTLLDLPTTRNRRNSLVRQMAGTNMRLI
jgi:hypothetical protein